MSSPSDQPPSSAESPLEPSRSRSQSNPQSTEQTSRPPTLSRASTASLEKCWICLCTREEDDPDNPPVWRSPCRCTLQAHESCLLDWVADQENPRNRRSSSHPDTILCPQCKSEIKVARPQNMIVNAVRSVDRAYGRLVLPSLAATLFGTVWAGCWAFGHSAVYIVFGPRDSYRLWHYTLTRRGIGSDLAYGLIPINLIFARTRYADFVLPSGTLFLLSTQLEDGLSLDWTMWPPLPSTVFACLPAARQLYNWGYEKAFGELNKRWIEEVQPRREEGYEGQEENIADILNEQEAQIQEEMGDGDAVVLELEVNLGGGEVNLDETPVGNGENNANVNGEGDDPLQGGGQQDQQQQAQQAGRVHQLLGDNELMVDTSSIGQMVIGALMLPVVSSSMGELLKLALPASWTAASNFYNKRPGLLSTKWGRSVLGGCLFIAMKDALVLYCRWRLATGHKKRRILDYDKTTKEYKLT